MANASSVNPGPGVSIAGPCPDRRQQAGRVAAVVLALLVGLCWVFPRFWYTRAEEGQSMVWYVAKTNVPGWRFESQDVDKSAEARLAADSATEILALPKMVH